MKRLKFILFFCLLLFCVAIKSQTIFYVSPTGDDSKNGLSWDDAFASVQKAIDVAYSSENKGEVYIKTGFYTIGATIELKEGVNIYGGFEGTESSHINRKKGAFPWAYNYASFLDGGSSVRVVNQSDNFSLETIVDGVTIMNGKNEVNGGGGAMINSGVIVRNSVFVNNNAGSTFGGGAILKGTGTLLNCNLYSNSTSGMGGGVALYDGGIIDGCTINNNNGSSGGAIVVWGNGTIKNALIENNSSLGLGGAIYVCGDGTKVGDGFIYNSIIRNNEVGSMGGGLCFNDTKCKVVNCLIIGNKVKNSWGSGAGVRSLGGGELINCNIVNNSNVGATGGGVYMGDGSKTKNCIIWNNTQSDGVQVVVEDSSGNTLFSNNAVQGLESILIPETVTANNNINLSAENMAIEGPNFVNVEEGTEDWHITSLSPCLNKGDNSFVSDFLIDIEGNERIQDGKVDIGAYELEVVIPNTVKMRGIVKDQNGTILKNVEISFTKVSDPTVVINTKSNDEGLYSLSNFEKDKFIVKAKYFGLYFNPVELDVQDQGNGVFEYNIVMNPVAGNANVYYVSANGSNDNDGSSWINSFSTVDFAIDKAKQNNKSVWIGKGTYLVSGSLYAADGINVYGGFDGSESSIGDRTKGVNAYDFTNETVIEGNKTFPILIQENDFTKNTEWNGVTISKGYSSNDGGCAVIKGKMTLSMVKIVNGVAGSFAGGIVLHKNALLTQSYIANNSSSIGAGVTCWQGGKVTESTITMNKAVGSGAGGSCWQGGEFDKCLIIKNEANFLGGGLYVYEDGSVTNCKLNYNNAGNFGGGIVVNNGGLLANSEIVGNSIVGGTEGGSGGGVALIDHLSIMTNCLVANNSALKEGGGVFMRSGGQVYNSIIWNNKSLRDKSLFSEWNHSQYDVVRNCAIENIRSCNYTDAAKYNIDLDSYNMDPYGPRFVSVEENNLDWQLKSGSPCVNAGDNEKTQGFTVDILGNVRIQKGKVDIGPYESSHDLLECNYAPNNLTCSVSGKYVDVSWTAPTSGSVLSYYIYRDGEKLNSEPITDTNYQDIVADAGEHSYYVNAMFVDGCVSPKSSVVTVTTECGRPKNLEISQIWGQQVAELSWKSPLDKDDVVLKWHTGVNNNEIGLTSDGTFIAAAKWTKTEISEYKDFRIAAIEVFLSKMSDVSVVIFQGGVNVYEKYIPNPSFEQFNIFKIDDYNIDFSKDLVVGIKTTHSAANRPMGIDQGPAIPNKGDLISVDNGKTWSSLSAMGLSFNWNISAILEYVGTDSKANVLSGYNVYRDGEKINNSIVTSKKYVDIGLTPGFKEYSVSAVWSQFGESELSESKTVEILKVTNDCMPPQIILVKQVINNVNISWNKPADLLAKGIDVLGYNIYRNGVKLNVNLLKSLSYTDNTIKEDGDYYYSVDVLLNNSCQSKQSDLFPFRFVRYLGPCLAPSNLVGKKVNDQLHVDLKWDTPIKDLRWHNGYNASGVGLNQQGTFYMAAKWSAEELGEWKGLTLTDIEFFHYEDDEATFTVYIYQGGTLQKTINATSPGSGEFVVVNVGDYSVDYSKDLMISIRVQQERGFPGGVDSGPATAGKGDLISYDGQNFLSISTEYKINSNWNISAILKPVSNAKDEEKANEIVELKRENISIDELSLTVVNSYDNLSKHDRGYLLKSNNKDLFKMAGSQFKHFNVYRNNELLAQVTDCEMIDKVGMLGDYKYYVTSVFDYCESARSNSVEVNMFTEDSECDAPSNLTGGLGAENTVSLNWESPAEQGPGIGIFDDFEGHQPFVINSVNKVPWTYVDADGAYTYGMEGAFYFPNVVFPKAYLLMSQNDVDPPQNNNADFNMVSGTKCIASFGAIFQAASDWIISPEIKTKGENVVSLYAKTFSNKYGYATFNVFYSTTNQNIGSFIPINEESVVTGKEWQNYKFTVPADAKYVAVKCDTDTENTILFVDDIFIGIEQTPPVLLGYDVFRNGVKVNTSPVSQTTFTQKIDNVGEYTYYVSSVWDNGCVSSPSNTITLNVSEGVTCPIPDITNYSANGKNAIIEWSIPSDLSISPKGYNVFRNDVKINSALLTQTQFTDSNLADGLYYYRVNAEWSNNCSSELSKNVGVRIGIPENCLPPRSLKGKESTKDYLAVELEWNLPKDPNPAVLAHHTGLNYSGIGLTEGGEFYVVGKWNPSDLTEYKNFKIKSVELVVNGDCDVTIVGYQGGKLVIYQPVGKLELNKFHNIKLDDGGFKIDNKKSLMIGYIADHESGSNCVGVDNGPVVPGKGDLYSTDGGETWVSLTQAGMNANWNISVYMEYDNSATKKLVKLDKPNSKSNISNSKIAVQSNDQIFKSSSAEAILLGYNVYRNDVKINTEPIEECSYKDVVPNKGTYSYHIKALYDIVESEKSNIIDINVMGLANVNNVDNNSIRIFPNPVADKMNIDGEYDYLQIYDISGKLIKTVNSESSVDFTDMERGIYIVKFHIKNETTVRKIVK